VFLFDVFIIGKSNVVIDIILTVAMAALLAIYASVLIKKRWYWLFLILIVPVAILLIAGGCPIASAIFFAEVIVMIVICLRGAIKLLVGASIIGLLIFIVLEVVAARLGGKTFYGVNDFIGGITSLQLGQTAGALIAFVAVGLIIVVLVAPNSIKK
jgi:hypothetical protein